MKAGEKSIEMPFSESDLAFADSNGFEKAIAIAEGPIGGKQDWLNGR